ncbi:MAG TPA: 2-oxoglutarate and iron-dependent oxygenase domain-containing protein [Actinophytocola sp.]|nr:2-oxoglutarate and iron-dependent oxygenase domain-containing protein [Actinophytocola sp.]
MNTIVLEDDFVPVIDLSTRDRAEGRAAIAEAIRTACETSGFFTIVGHGVSRDLITRMHAATNAFFTMPEEEKERSANRAGVSGLRRLGSYEAFAAHVTGDLPEAVRAALGDYPSTWKVANIWPAAPADFAPTWREYLAAMTDLAADVMRLFALALELDEKFFDDKFDNHVSLMLANYYYSRDDEPAPAELRRESHTDWGTLTVLYQEHDNGGLQVRREDGEWRDVPAVPDSFVVNIGDLMAFWTGWRWASTVHRVVNPDGANAPSRISIPFFYLPNHDAPIEPVTADRNESAVTVGKWFTDKVRAAYAPELEESA